MAKHLVEHLGVGVNVRKRTPKKNGVTYPTYEIADYSTGKRVRHYRPTLKEAKALAKDVCKCLVAGRREILEWSAQQCYRIRQALKLLEPTGVTIDRASAIVTDAVKLVSPEEIVAACRSWHDDHAKRRMTPRAVNEAVPEFLKRRAARVSQRRYRTDHSYLGMFAKKFSDRNLHEVTTLEIKDWAVAKSWKPKTKNDALGLVRLMYADAIERGYAAENPAKGIKRESLGTSDVGIFTPGQVLRILNAVEDRMKPFFSLIFFSGVRKEECSRLSVAQVREGLKSGAVFLPASITKTNRCRSILLRENVKAWLTRYLPIDGPLLPAEWQCMERLDELGAYAARRAGLDWVYNGPRHSFATYVLRITRDPAQVVKEMGNSLAQLDRHYNSRADSVTQEVAKEYFGIMPPPLPAQVIELAQQPMQAASLTG